MGFTKVATSTALSAFVCTIQMLFSSVLLIAGNGQDQHRVPRKDAQTALQLSSYHCHRQALCAMLFSCHFALYPMLCREANSHPALNLSYLFLLHLLESSLQAEHVFILRLSHLN